MPDDPTLIHPILVNIQADQAAFRNDLAQTNARIAELGGKIDETGGRLDQTNANLTLLISESRATNARLDQVITELRTLRIATANGFSAVDARFDSLIQITGSHHANLEDRVRVIEDHLGLPHGAG